jgi:hypothetical protein
MAQTFEVVHGLVNNVKVVMSGTQRFPTAHRRSIEEFPPQTAKHQWTAFGRHWVSLYCVQELESQKPITTTDMMQQIANDINKMNRSLLIDSTIVVLWY